MVGQGPEHQGLQHAMGVDPHEDQLDDGWPESAEEHVALVLLYRECKEHIKETL